jgi:hypothetical protein
MSMNQVLAKIGVFALIIINLGAYYVFWPETAPHAAYEGQTSLPSLPPKAVEKGENTGKPAQVALAANAAQTGRQGKPSLLQGDGPRRGPVGEVDGTAGPAAGQEQEGNQPGGLSKPSLFAKNDLSSTDLPPIPELPAAGALPSPSSSAVPATPPAPVPQGDSGPGIAQVKAEDPTREQLKRLMETFPKEGLAKGSPSKGNPLPPPDPFPLATKEIAKLQPMPAGNASPTPIAQSDLWTLQMEVRGGQNVLTARLNKGIEFRIVCDQVEMKTLEGAVHAIGKVGVTGPGLKASCNRLIIGLGNDSLVLDGKAELQLQQGNGASNPAAELKGEQLTFRLQQPGGQLSGAQAFPAPLTPVPTPAAPIPAPEPFPPSKRGP